MMLTDKERLIARRLQGDLPIVSRPFQDIAAASGQTEGNVIELIGAFMRRGVIRKFGAIVRHQKVGFTRNAMVVWAVPSDRSEEVGQTLSAKREITHCYERQPPFLGKYNLFSMIHLKGDDPEAYVRRLASEVNIPDFRILLSEEELKKSSMEYFT